MPPSAIIAVVLRVCKPGPLFLTAAASPHDEIRNVSRYGFWERRVLARKLADDIRISMCLKGEYLETRNNLYSQH